MEKTRTLKELYELLLHYYKEEISYDPSGICFAIGCIFTEGKITEKEHTILRKSFRRNKPSLLLHKEFYNRKQIKSSLYWWPYGKKETRILFLEKMVNYVELPWYEKLWDRLK